MTLLCALLIQIGTNFYNDYADFQHGADTESRLGPARATQRGWLTPQQMRHGAWGAFLASALAGLYLVSIGGWPILLLGLLSIAMGFAYTGGPFPLAYHGLGELAVFVFFGFGAVCGTYFLQTGSISDVCLAAAAALGALASAILVVNNLRDVQTDQAAGKNTLAVRFGVLVYPAAIPGVVVFGLCVAHDGGALWPGRQGVAFATVEFAFGGAGRPRR